MVLGDHLQSDLLATEKSGQRIDIKMAADILGGNIFQDARFPDACRVDQGFDMPESLDHSLHQLVNLLLLGQIAADRNCRSSGFLQFVDGLFGLFECVVGMDGQLVASGSQDPRHAISNAGRTGTGNKGYWF
jgi:hypothetical protein